MVKWKLPPVVDERTDWEAFGKAEDAALDIDCSEVKAISSAGLINWIRFFEQMRGRGVRLRFMLCPAVVMGTAAMVRKDFVAAGEVASVRLLFNCNTCDKSHVLDKDMAEIKAMGFDLEGCRSQVICKDGGCEVEFDDADDSFFAIFDP